MRAAPLSRLVKWAPWAVLALALLGVLATHGAGPTLIVGDAQEYVVTLESWFGHGSPDQRPSDAAAASTLLAAHGHTPTRMHDGFFPDKDGRWYGYHFWVYPLLAVPAKAVLQALHGDELAAFEVTNLVLLAAALVFAMRARSLPVGRRALFIALAALGPVLWYVRWPHAEIYLWAFVVAGLSALDARRYALAAALFSMAAMQSQPIALLAAATVGLSLRSWQWRTTMVTACAALPSLVPAAFYLWHFGHPSPMAAGGLLRMELISFGRVSSFFTDLDQGVLVHAPATVVLGAIGAVVSIRHRAVTAITLTCVAIAMVAATTTTVNWNAGCCGMLRYGVWIIPIMAWIAARWMPRGPVALGLSVAAIALQLNHVRTRVGADDSLEHGPLARAVLAHAPALYDAEPEIFVERTLSRPTDAPWVPFPLPVGFVADGVVTKIYTDAFDLEALADMYVIDESYARDIRTRYAGRRGGFYIDPPRAKVRERPHDEVVARTPRTTFLVGVTLGEGWHMPHVGGAPMACIGKRGSMSLGAAVDRDLSMRVWLPLDLLNHPIRVRVFANGVALDDINAFCRFTRTYHLPSGASDVVLEASETVNWVDGGGEVGLCVDSLEWR